MDKGKDRVILDIEYWIDRVEKLEIIIDRIK